MKFCELDLKPEIQKALTGMGYEDLTPIQEKTFSAILKGEGSFGPGGDGFG